MTQRATEMLAFAFTLCELRGSSFVFSVRNLNLHFDFSQSTRSYDTTGHGKISGNGSKTNLIL